MKDISIFKKEPYEKFRDYLLDILDKKGIELVKEMLDHIMPKQNETAREHIQRRHMTMDEEEMVTEALTTGQNQGLFAYGYKNPMTFDEICDCVLDAIYDNIDQIAKEYVYGTGKFDMPIESKYDYPIGYGINSNLELVKSNTIRVMLTENKNPQAEFKLQIDTCIPIVSNTSKEIIKNRDALIDEYHISRKELERYRYKQQKRSDYKGRKEEERNKKNEYLKNSEIRRIFKW